MYFFLLFLYFLLLVVVTYTAHNIGMLFSHRHQLEDINISTDEIKSWKHLGMLEFEERVWKALGQNIDKEDRRMVNSVF